MMPVSGVNTGAAQPAAGTGKVPGAPQAEKPEEKDRSRPPKPVMDEYIPEKKEGGEELWMGSTEKVDREIEALKRKRTELEQQLSTETDEAKIRALERRLAQVERELKQKDSDAYRKQHSTATRLS